MQALVETGALTDENFALMPIRKRDWHDYDGVDGCSTVASTSMESTAAGGCRATMRSPATTRCPSSSCCSTAEPIRCSRGRADGGRDGSATGPR